MKTDNKVFGPKDIVEKAQRILSYGIICDHCLGRQFGQMLKGYSNAERGRAIRLVVAMANDSEKLAFDESNFSGIGFRRDDVKKEGKVCCICEGFFSKIDSYVDKASKLLGKREFSSFVVGTKLSENFVINEESLWEAVGIDYCEPIKAEINREVGKRIEKIMGKKADFEKPEIVVLIDFAQGDVYLEVNSLLIFGRYQKLVRGIPQTKWPSGKYKNSVEQIIAKPFMKFSKGAEHALHGCGREDIDAKCLAWRPFVLEVTDPEKRNVPLLALAKEVGKGGKVKIKDLRVVGKDVVVKVKEIRPEKTYRAIVSLKKPFEKEQLRELSKLRTMILQQTPERVLHRRTDKLRKRAVKEVKCKVLGKKKLEMIFRADAGTYIKELISGDNGRTSPSMSSILRMPAKCTSLDVIGIHVKESL